METKYVKQLKAELLRLRMRVGSSPKCLPFNSPLVPAVAPGTFPGIARVQLRAAWTATGLEDLNGFSLFGQSKHLKCHAPAQIPVTL